MERFGRLEEALEERLGRLEMQVQIAAGGGVEAARMQVEIVARGGVEKVWCDKEEEDLDETQMPTIWVSKPRRRHLRLLCRGSQTQTANLNVAVWVCYIWVWKPGRSVRRLGFQPRRHSGFQIYCRRWMDMKE